jgi:hypothetical protein
MFPLVENSVTIKAVSNTVSYQQAVANCKADGKQLCTSKEICEDGNTPNSGPIAGDHWVPVKDSFNEWLQIGIGRIIILLTTSLYNQFLR